MKKSTCYLIKLRRIIGATPCGGDQPDDAIVMQDIARKRPATIVAGYAKLGVHVVQMVPIPDWEGTKT